MRGDELSYPSIPPSLATAATTKVCSPSPAFFIPLIPSLLPFLSPPSPPSLSRLLLNSWGYNTAEERALAASHPSITYLETEQAFIDYVKQRHRHL